MIAKSKPLVNTYRIEIKVSQRVKLEWKKTLINLPKFTVIMKCRKGYIMTITSEKKTAG